MSLVKISHRVQTNWRHRSSYNILHHTELDKNNLRRDQVSGTLSHEGKEGFLFHREGGQISGNNGLFLRKKNTRHYQWLYIF